jgi:hypothetical protein
VLCLKARTLTGFIKSSLDPVSSSSVALWQLFPGPFTPLPQAHNPVHQKDSADEWSPLVGSVRSISAKKQGNQSMLERNGTDTYFELLYVSVVNRAETVNLCLFNGVT